ncbi:hypothetical protein GCM10023203_55700 [Actinomycetospora straminea]|uniref:Uncharacterized protein n=1 Tax=Actinomycetospora straminea TaxID=663607 RepID=A0ABP9FEC7_9PSEU
MASRNSSDMAHLPAPAAGEPRVTPRQRGVDDRVRPPYRDRRDGDAGAGPGLFVESEQVGGRYRAFARARSRSARTR